MRALDKLREAIEFLKKHKIEEAGREAEDIIVYCLKIDRTTLLRDNPLLHREELAKIDELLKRRSNREPPQYILGYVDFCGLKIRVGQGVLIPRPETELLVEEAIKTVKSYTLKVKSKDKNSSLIPHYSSLSILDLCTGSGCLALALAREFTYAHAYGTDISEVAIRYAKENAKINNINNVTFLKGNLFEPVAQLITLHSSLITFDLIVSNPPYIRSEDIKTLQPEIKDWEPTGALNGGEDGLDYYRAIIPGSKRYLKEGGSLILELGVNQAEEARRMAINAGFKDISLIKDYAGIDRILIAKSGHK